MADREYLLFDIFIDQANYYSYKLTVWTPNYLYVHKIVATCSLKETGMVVTVNEFVKIHKVKNERFIIFISNFLKSVDCFLCETKSKDSIPEYEWNA